MERERLWQAIWGCEGGVEGVWLMMMKEPRRKVYILRLLERRGLGG